MKEDSIDGIFDTLKICAQISKSAGGIGLHVHNVRAKHSYIRGTNGTSNGIVPMLRVYNATARYVDQVRSALAIARATGPLMLGGWGVASALAHLQSTSSRGTPTSSTSSTCARIQAPRSTARGSRLPYSTYCIPSASPHVCQKLLFCQITRLRRQCRDLFCALWIPDLFMQRVEEDGLWSLFCPCECPGPFSLRKGYAPLRNRN